MIFFSHDSHPVTHFLLQLIHVTQTIVNSDLLTQPVRKVMWYHGRIHANILYNLDKIFTLLCFSGGGFLYSLDRFAQQLWFWAYGLCFEPTLCTFFKR